MLWFKYIFADKIWQNFFVCLLKIGSLMQKCTITIVFKKTPFFAENRWNSPKNGENHRKLVKIAENRRKLVKIGENRRKFVRKFAKIGEMKLRKIGTRSGPPIHVVRWGARCRTGSPPGWSPPGVNSMKQFTDKTCKCWISWPFMCLLPLNLRI
jgi:hypothetical protein